MRSIKLLIVSIFLFSNIYSNAQNERVPNIYEGKTTYFAQYAGMPSTLISLHYDKVFLIQRKHYMSYAFGLGAGHPDTLFDEDRFSIPTSFNYTTGLGAHHFEMGGGLTYLYSTHKSGILIGFKFGYKIQTRHLYFRISSAPSGYIVTFHKDIIEGTEYKNTDLNNNLFGLSLGYSFN